MSTLLIDDHLLRDVLSNNLAAESAQILDGHDLATTNLWYVRLCRSVAAARGGRLTSALTRHQRQALGSHLVDLGDRVTIAPIVDFAWTLATYCDRYRLSTLGAEALAAARLHDASVCVWAGDDGPNLRAACSDLAVDYIKVKA